MAEDKRRTEAIDSFYEAYRELQQYDSVRMHSRTGLWEDTLIEITRYYGERKGERILRVTQEDEAAAYEQAADQVKKMLEQIKQDRKVGQRGA